VGTCARRDEAQCSEGRDIDATPCPVRYRHPCQLYISDTLRGPLLYSAGWPFSAFYSTWHRSHVTVGAGAMLFMKLNQEAKILLLIVISTEDIKSLFTKSTVSQF